MNAIKKISGIVIKGKQGGHRLGFPTANIALNTNEIPSGVYIGSTYFDNQKRRSAIFIGNNRDILETHILDFEGDLYGKNIQIEIGQKIREVIKFESEKALINQVLQDLFRARDAKL